MPNIVYIMADELGYYELSCLGNPHLRTPRLDQMAKEFIRQHRDQPFFCYLPNTPPHGIFDIPDRDPAWQLFKDQPWPEPARRYAAMDSMVDRHVGEVLDLLRELELERNTIVFFSGDNGGADYFAAQAHTPVREGEFFDREIHERDRRAKFGGH